MQEAALLAFFDDVAGRARGIGENLAEPLAGFDALGGWRGSAFALGLRGERRRIPEDGRRGERAGWLDGVS